VGCSDQQGDQCNKCFTPFTLNNGSCTIANCKSTTDYGCSQCEANYFLKNDGACYPKERGCDVYSRGICQYCLQPYTLNNGKCEIDGCSNYDSKGLCLNCSSPFILDSTSGICNILNCIETKAGKCIVCNSGYHLHNGECLKPLQNCIDHVSEICR
jgi:hypothetical protein